MYYGFSISHRESTRSVDGRMPSSLEMARQLRGKGVTAALLLPNSFRSGLIARLSGAGVRVGYRRSARGPLLSHALPAPRQALPVSAPGYYARLAGYALGIEDIDMRLEPIVNEFTAS
ncbi:MAG: hypothetical protein IIB89_12365, partial [Chloroflexi bacterium]|nr:hypothetical protein [Chloroflexota bacterium]